MNETAEQLKTISKIFNTSKIITSQDVQDVLGGIVHILAEHKKSTEDMNESSRQTIMAILDRVVDRHNEHKDEVSNLVDEKNSAHAEKIQTLTQEIKELMKEAVTRLPKNGKPGKDADPKAVAAIVLSKIKIPEYKKTTKATPVEIADSLEALEEEDRLNASALEEKSLLALIEKFFKQNKFVKYAVSGSRFLSTLFDVVLTNPTDGQVLKYQASTKTWVNGTGGSGGGGFSNQVILSGSGTAYTLPSSPAGIVLLFANGQLLVPGGVDYTLSGTSVTTVLSWATGALTAVF